MRSAAVGDMNNDDGSGAGAELLAFVKFKHEYEHERWSRRGMTGWN